MPDPAPRIPRIRRTEWNDAVREVFAALGGPEAREQGTDHFVITTFAQHPDLTQPFLVFNRHLLYATTLPIRLRQLAILRVAWTRGATYMWASHMRLSLQLGLAVEDFEAVKQGAEHARWSELERQVLRAVDQLRDGSDLDDETWDALSAHWDRRQMLDFLFTVGAYILLALVMNATRIQREPDLEELARQHGSPPRAPGNPSAD